MAERNVAVRLSANVNSYVAAMAKAKAATTGLSDSSSSLTRLGGTLQSVGKMATIGVTLPLLAVGAGAVAMATKFDTAFAQMVGLANVPAAEVDALKESVLALAGETAVAPQELAEGLYFAASAGLDAAAAMEVVEMAARASAAGMGTTADVVNLVSGAIAAYGEDNITAAQATDILTAAIREGKAEPSEFADALGRVTPIAASMGISFGEVAGAAAFMSNIIGDTDETITALRGALLAMLDPTEQGRKTLEDMGTSYAELKAAIDQDGLLGALDLLREHGFAENSEAMSNLFEDNRALVGATILLNDANGDLVPTIDAVTNSAGSLDSAFGAVSDTAGFKMKQAMTDIKVAMIEVGEILLPLAADIATSISGMIGWFTELSPAAQTVVVAIAGIAAAAGPLIFIAGSLIKNFTILKGALTGLGTAGAVVGVLGGIAIAAGAAYLAFKFFTRSEDLATTHIDIASTALETETVAVYNAAVAAGEATTQVDALAIAHLALSNAISEAADPELNTALATLNVTSEETLDVLTRLGSGSLPTIQAEMQRLTEEYFGLDAAQAQVALNMRGQGKSYEEIASTIGRTVEVVEAWDSALGTTTTFADQNKDEINDLALAYLNIQARIPGAASEALLAAEAIAGSRDEAMNAVPVYEEYIRQLTLMDPAQAQAALTAGGMASTIEDLIPGYNAAASGAEDLTGATEELTAVQASSIDTMSQFGDRLAEIDHYISEYDSALDHAVGQGGEWVRRHYDMAKAFREFSDGITDGDGEIDLLTQGIDANTEAGGENAGTILDMADNIIAMTKANLDAGKGQEETNREYQAARTALLDAAEAAGLNRGDVEALIDTYGLVPDLVTTTMQIANDALMKWRIDRYIEKLDEVDATVATQIEAAIDENDWALANRLINNVVAPRWVDIFANLHGFGGLTGRGWSLASHALGAYIPQPEVAMLHGNEAVLPLGDPARMRQLVADPRIGEPLLAAMSQVGSGVSAAMSNLMPYYSAAPATVAGGDTINVTVHNNGRDLSGEDIARAIDRHRVRR